MNNEKKTRPVGEEEGGPSTQSWMMTFSDLSTLLLTFFVLLLSMSSLNERAFRNAFVNFTSASGIMFFMANQSVSIPRDEMVTDLVKTLQSIHVLDSKKMKETTESDTMADEEFNLVLSGNAIVFNKQPNEEGFSFIFGEKLLFESSSATLNPKAYPILDKVAGFLRETPYRAYIDGHSDDLPISNPKYATNDELSLARAMTIMEYLVNHRKVNPERLALAGYGDSHPVANNGTERSRALNRRVEIVFRKTL